MESSGCECYCNYGYTGTLCEEEMPCSESVNNACENGGNVTGMIPENNCGCECNTDFFFGDYCENVKTCTDLDDALVCANNGLLTGSAAEDSCACVCSREWVGITCEEKAVCTSEEIYCYRGHINGSIVDENCACMCEESWFGDFCQNEESNS